MTKSLPLRHAGTRPARNAKPSRPAPVRPPAILRDADAALAADIERLAAKYEIERVLGWLIYDVHRLLGRAFDARIRAIGLTRPQWRVMMHLIRFDGLTQTELAERLETEKAPLGKILDKLEEGGWLVRRADPADRRVRRVHATGKIAPFLPQLLEIAQDLFAQALKDLKPADIKTLTGALTRMKINLGGDADEGRL